MKTSASKIGVTAALLCIAPLLGFAQGFSGSGTAGRNLDRLTLLPGPYLLSPARTTPTMMPPAVKLSVAPGLSFGSSIPRFSFEGRGTLRLVERNSPDPVPVSGATNNASRPNARPSPESLRFESALKPQGSSQPSLFKYSPSL
jgi:hypothetical protein